MGIFNDFNREICPTWLPLTTTPILGQVPRPRDIAIILAAFVLYYPYAVAWAEGDQKSGSLKARACQVCHGKNGRSANPAYPRLAGQHAKYIVKQLKAFKDGLRKDPVMNGMAATLNDQDMEDVAAFFENK